MRGEMERRVVIGTRRPDDTAPWELEAGDYCLRNGDPFVCLPDGTGPCNLANWSPVWHEDGTLTLSPSILDADPAKNGQGWHGYLERGVWRQV
jgi:hypothetical protein